MGRWKPDARSRLVKAALTLYSSRGFAQTTVAEIAERAGLTERTFFRYFADKREVLFAGGEAMQQQLVAALDEAPASLSAIDAVGVAVEGIAPMFEGRAEYVRKRQAIIEENPELQERERIKLASLATALAVGLRRRGVRDPAAALAAEMGVTIFRAAFDRWLKDKRERTFAKSVRESLDELKAVSAGK